MVLVHFKKTETDSFLYETTADTSLDDITREIATISNMRFRAQRLAEHAEDLCKHGIMRPTDQHGLDDEILEKSTGQAGLNERPAPTDLPADRVYNPDPCGRRDGIAPTDETCEVIRRSASNLRTVVDKKQVDMKVPLTIKMIQDAIDEVRGAVTMVWPMGIPEFDPVREAFEDNEDLSGQAASQDVLDGESCVLWWASKQLDRSKKLGDYTGKNEKTKIVAKMTKKGGQAPAKEPPLDAEGQKNLVAYWHKKQEEAKKLAEEQEDDYMNSDWANPKNIKNHFQGMGDVKWRV